MGKFQFLWVHYVNSLIAEVCGKRYKYSIQISSFLPRQLIDLVSSSLLRPELCLIFPVIYILWPRDLFSHWYLQALCKTPMRHKDQDLYQEHCMLDNTNQDDASPMCKLSIHSIRSSSKPQITLKTSIPLPFHLLQVSPLLSQALPAYLLKFAQVEPLRSSGTCWNFSKPL